MNKELDQFYTKPEVAERCIDRVQSMLSFDDYDNIIEPSAGDGALLRLLPEDKRIGVDLDPHHPEILKMDFFDYKFPKGKNLVIGNPPFGYKSKLAIDFFNKCAVYADAIFWIVPRSWSRYGIHSRLNKGIELYWNCLMPDNSFTFGEEDYNVKCVAQLWSKDQLHNGGMESWNESIPIENLETLHQYQIKNNCYGKSPTLF